MKRLFFIFLSISLFLVAAVGQPDTVSRAHNLRPVEILGVKQIPGSLDAEAVTGISGVEARRLGIDAMKGISGVAPNFYMPDYGSRMTSSIYVRGLGARIDQPVVGLKVDNVPVLNKDAYDFDIADIESIEVIRGAQAVMNGRNSMAGQINVMTLSPLRAKGLRALVEYGTANGIKASASYYGQLRSCLGMSLAGQYNHTDGFFHNEYNGGKVGLENSGSLRWKTAWQPRRALSMSNVASLGISRQNGYPYASWDDRTIAYNDTCSYRRTSFADGLTVAWAGKRVVVTSLTSVQYMSDRMDLDQDFRPDDYFTLTQDRKEWALTEDLFTRGTRGRYSWLGGVFAFYKDTDMDAPVTFKDTGISRLIEFHRNDVNPEYPIRWDSRRFTLGSNFKLGSRGVALYHESVFRLGDWRFEAGLRLDYEYNSLSYRSHCRTGYSTYHILPDGREELYSHTPLDVDDTGRIHHSFMELIPKLTVAYQYGPFSPYFNFSKGYKAGGYNTQMFSDVLQQRIMSEMGMTALYKLEDIVAYDPERSLNYELGFHSHPVQELKIDGVLFYIDCRNQQMTVFPPGTTTGRIMTNAGRTRSLGAELSVEYRPSDDVTARLSYGFTNATFRNYDDGRNDYRGKRVPYAPSNTLFAEINWNATPWQFAGIVPFFNANVNCAGKIYWNEANTITQPFYCQLALSAGLMAGHWSLRLWSRNLTDTRFDTFYFMSMGNSFVQRGLPRRIGLTLRVNI